MHQLWSTEIGSFAISDAERQRLWDRRQELEGGYAQVEVMELSEGRGVPRVGVFVGMHPGKGSQEALEVLAAREL